MASLAPGLGSLAFLVLAVPAAYRWRVFVRLGDRARAQREAVRVVLALAAAVVLAIIALLMGTGRHA